MTIIKVIPNSNGSHDNQSGAVIRVPEGWALIPPDMEIPDTFPFVDVTADDGVVTSLTAGVMPPEPTSVSAEPTQLDRVEAQALYTALLTGTLLEDK